ncbi:metalloregulator ArsR/SmtB family transcription factor [Asanoa sp. WMMD1127]|uniref:ArsR/SmtB family transcription factor n=1 Tax=Asanoa sp. WMMD1127 TaxID=3016107 RepID=UPI0024167EF6|nr:metalloregulator ArsR/SmtB family transcription factor [Asanoa sp. WMMD1127]MDG4820497.1 metalloregulator ArsR/SmtB family transcription factor [Asanoa sp. WMMD1127]
MAELEGVFTSEAVEAVTAVLQALALPLRLRIVLDILDREATAADLADRLDVGYGTLAQHLRHLRLAGLVQRRRAGNHVRYVAAPSTAVLVRAILAEVAPEARSGAHISGARPRH